MYWLYILLMFFELWVDDLPEKWKILAIQRRHTMPRFINHDGISDGWLNLGHCSGSGVLLPWKLQLTNTGDILDLMLLRIEKDWVTLTPKMRKPWNSVSLESWWFDELMKHIF